MTFWKTLLFHPLESIDPQVYMPGTGGPSITETHAQMRTMADTPLFGIGRGQSQRLLSGFLEHILDNRASKRFAVLERDLDTDDVYLKLYRDHTEAALRKTYIFTKDNFVGTERGSVRRHSKYPVLYWAIILTTETVLFQDDRYNSSEFERWNDLMKELWRHQSWMVKPVYGVSQSNEKQFVLHLNKASLGLAHVNPPRNFLRWDIREVQEATSNGKSFMFTVVSSGGNSGYYEVRTDKEKQSSKIQEAFTMQTYDIPNIGDFTTCEKVQRYTEGQVAVAGPTQLPSPSTSTVSSIDPTTGEDIHMNMQDLQETHQAPQTTPLKVPTHLPLKDTSKKNPTPPSPSSSQGSPVTTNPCKKKFRGPKIITGRGQRKNPEVPPRTSSWVPGETSPPVTKIFSMSTGNLRDPSPTYFNNRLSTASGYSSGSNSPDVTISAKQLPLPIPPLAFLGGRNSPLLHHPKPPSIDENSVYAGSNSSLASQSPTPSMSPMSLSDEESRYPSTVINQGSPKEHTRCSSDVGVNYHVRGTYVRSMSMPTETDGRNKPPSIAGHTLDMPYYINIKDGSPDPVYINVSKKDDVYENPPIYHQEYEPQNPLPLPPRSSKPITGSAGPRLPRKTHSLEEQRPTEVSDILEEILKSERQLKGSNLGMTYATFSSLCFRMDVDNIGPKLNNWKGLAQSIGIETVSDIQMIDSFTRRHSRSPTDIVLYYWHCQINPPRKHCMEELKAILSEMEREDILQILSDQRDTDQIAL